MHTPTSRNWQTHTYSMATTPTHGSKNRGYATHSGQQHHKTPATSRRAETLSTPSSGSLFTPSPICNPFESEYEQLQHAVVTPGVFREQIKATPDKERPFQWDIEHVALLNPVDFGDVTDKLERQDRQCRKTDTLVQHHVGKFFEKEEIMPSPLTEPVPKVNLLTMIEEEERSAQSESKRHVSSQTDIHIPLSVDFNEIFKSYKLSNSQIEELNQGESFSNSSLRRKLFNNDSNCSTPDGHSRSACIAVTVSNQDSPPTVGADWCASSPVFGGRFEDVEYSRRCSVVSNLRRGDDCNREASPDLSPITSPFKSSSTYQTGQIKTSPDLHEGLAKMKSGFSFNMQDNFRLSNTGLSTISSSSSDERDVLVEDGLEQPTRDTDISVDMHISQSCATALEGRRPDYQHPTNQSLLTAEVTTTESQPFGQSDTGYQTTSLVSLQTLGDTTGMHPVDSGVPSHNEQYLTAAASPQKSSHDWEPPVASTPNKHHLFDS